ncbi:MAG: hypothetical protein ACTFAL_08535 [Candidatus Electronema sp. V4]|uniref:hypothetical protein n=1 Tax=Candidatus Electronema sp. V4 TaxID=3454756 RepID=UPI0040559BF2
MAYQRKSSKHIADAQERAANLRGIDPALDFGNDLTLAAFNAEIAATQNLLDAYNAKLAKADAAGNDFKAAEKRLRAQSARMLAGVGVKHGKDSSEYEMAGGTRASEINYHPNTGTETPPAGGEN